MSLLLALLHLERSFQRSLITWRKCRVPQLRRADFYGYSHWLAWHMNSPLVSRSEIEKKELPQSITQSQKNSALIQLLRSWREGDEQEQKSTWEYLRQALDEDRLSERKLFP